MKDTGSGMPAEVIARAFDPFFTTKEVDQGTGLGLSMVYGLVQQSGGQVHIESTVDLGTTVTLYLPINRDGTSQVVADVAMPRIETGQNKMILVIEDDREVREVAVTMLQQLGYQVLQSDIGADALDLIAEVEQIDLLLSDVVLPGGMSGRALAEAARNHRPGLKILFMSGYARDAFDADGRPDPGDDLLPKPFRKADLATAVRRALDS
ncbi:MAG: response regulator [Alphaproteobacteria bacterium]|nr:response regulator [Alphaproteobacteria bacterium]